MKHITYEEILQAVERGSDVWAGSYEEYEGTKENVLEWINANLRDGYDIPGAAPEGNFLIFYGFPDNHYGVIGQINDVGSVHCKIPINDEVWDKHHNNIIG